MSPIVARLLPFALLLAGCATPADKFDPNPQVAASRTADATGAIAAVQAFGHLCGRMEEAEVLRRARGYGFAAVDPQRLAGGAAPPSGLRVLSRPGGGAPAVLIWGEAGPSCELGVGGIDRAALTTAFDAFLAGLEQRPEIAVRSMPIPPEQTGRFRLERAALLAPRALVPAPPRTMGLRLAPPGSTGIEAVMVVRVLLPGAEATPPPAQGAAKD